MSTDNCQKYSDLYHGSNRGSCFKDSCPKFTSCMENNVSQEYVCPKVSPGCIEEPQQHPWFAQQSQNLKQQQCHEKKPILGRYNLCPDQSIFSHQRGGSLCAPCANHEHPYQYDPNPDSQNTQDNANNMGMDMEIGMGMGMNGDNNNNYQICGDNQVNMHPMLYEQLHSRPIQDSLSSMSKLIGNNSEKSCANDNKFGIHPRIMSICDNPESKDCMPCKRVNNIDLDNNITPSYYLDMTETIGKRPVHNRRTHEYNVPNFFKVNNPNFPDRTVGCCQPCWGVKCI